MKVFLLFFNFILAQTISLTYKATRDTSLKYWKAFFMGMPKASVSLCRKDLNKTVTFINDPNWQRIPIIFGDISMEPRNWKINVFYYPYETFKMYSLSIDTGRILFVTSGGRTPPYGYFKTKITMYNWNTRKLEYI
ncbi:MAG: hypothetical protein ABIK76_05050 [candidate division WOR-3 bacterium]